MLREIVEEEIRAGRTLSVYSAVATVVSFAGAAYIAYKGKPELALVVTGIGAVSAMLWGNVSKQLGDDRFILSVLDEGKPHSVKLAYELRYD